MRVEEDRGNTDQESLQRSGLVEALTDWTVWWLAIAGCFILVGVSFGTFFPTIAATMGYSPTVTLLLCVPPWFVGAVTSLFVTWSVLIHMFPSRSYLTSLAGTPTPLETVSGTLLVPSQ